MAARTTDEMQLAKHRDALTDAEMETRKKAKKRDKQMNQDEKDDNVKRVMDTLRYGANFDDDIFDSQQCNERYDNYMDEDD